MATDAVDLSLSSYPDPGLFDPTAYDAGLSDGTLNFSGSSGLPDVTAGSDFLGLSSFVSGPDNSSSVYDSLDPAGALTLSGVTDPFFGPSGAYSTPTPNPAPPNNMTNSLLQSLGKFGAGLATMFAGQQSGYTGTARTVGPQTVASKNPLSVNGSSTTILLIVIAAAVLLLMREGE
jgi:hypothetical protein